MSQNDEVLVRVEGVSKKFCRSLKKSLWYGVCDIAGELLPFGKRQRVAGSELLVASGNKSAGGASEPTTSYSPLATPEADLNSWDDDLREGEFYAVKNISFELRRGECLGLIGHNGAGKTTLLKMLNGLIKPDRGSITMRGRVGALIALGAGFNPILTGRENIYINGSVLGLTKKEIDAKIDEIIDFAEIREFIDMPVQSYSSGMTVRLGFAVATALDPDVLILDEVLAVGDVAFRYKCYRRIDEIRNRAAIIFVSHNMPDVGRICQTTVVMERGRTIFHGNALDGIARYNEINESGGRFGNARKEMQPMIREFSVEMPERVGFNEPLDLKIKVASEETIGPVDLTVALSNQSGGYAAVGLSNSQSFGIEIRQGENEWICRLANIPLRNGRYPVTVHLIDRLGKYIAIEANCRDLKIDRANDGIPGECQLQLLSWKKL